MVDAILNSPLVIVLWVFASVPFILIADWVGRQLGLWEDEKNGWRGNLRYITMTVVAFAWPFVVAYLWPDLWSA